MIDERSETTQDGWQLKRWWTPVSIAFAMLLMIEMISTHYSNDNPFIQAYIAYVSIFWSGIYFALIILVIPFLTAHHARPSPFLFMVVSIVSISLTILSYSLVYRHFGIVGPDKDTPLKVGDYLYFSAVTFSTLGYGDFRPSPDARLYAAFQSILGNLHLGMTVGVMFYAISGENGRNNPHTGKRKR